MPSVDVRNLKNEVVGKLQLSDEVFGGPVNEGLVHDAVKQYLASQRSGTHKTKTRAEVAGSGRKPWKQKGTGRAGSAKCELLFGARAARCLVPCHGLFLPAPAKDVSFCAAFCADDETQTTIS
jgi:hypothetical protein